MNQHYTLLVFLSFFIVHCSCTSQSPAKELKGVEDVLPFRLKSNPSKTLKFSSGVRAILEDQEGNFWFGAHQEGVAKIDGETFTYFTVEDGLSNNQVRSIYEDSNGRVWFECGIGISSYDGSKIITHKQKDHSVNKDWKAKEGDLWFKGDEPIGYNQNEILPGVYRWDGYKLTYLTFPVEVEKDQSNGYSISTPFVRGKNGRIWFGTYNSVFGFDGVSVQKIDSESLGLDDMSGYLHVRSLFEDSKGRLWIGNNGIGVLVKEKGEIYNFSEANKLISVSSGRNGGHRSAAGTLEHVFSIGEDSEGNIWFGDRDTGAWKYDGSTMKNYGVKDGLTTTHIWQIYETSSGALWFAMADGSVCEFREDSFVRVF